MDFAVLKPEKHEIMKKGGVWVPTPMAHDGCGKIVEFEQKLLIRYYIESGARTVIPAAHTGEFALGHDFLYGEWLDLNKQVTDKFGRDMFLMAAVSSIKQAEIAAEKGYDIVMVSPKAVAGMSEEKAIGHYRNIASIIPVFGFYLQEAVGGPYLSPNFWKEIFKFAYGAKIAPFDRRRTKDVLRVAAESERFPEMVFATGNDDNIVYDLYTRNIFRVGKKERTVNFSAGLLGHFATDTFSAVKITEMIIRNRGSKNPDWGEAHSLEYLAGLFTSRNFFLFDARNRFRNSVMGVKLRLCQLGLLSHVFVYNEPGRNGLDQEIRNAYSGPFTDDVFIRKNIDQWKREIKAEVMG